MACRLDGLRAVWLAGGPDGWRVRWLVGQMACRQDGWMDGWLDVCEPIISHAQQTSTQPSTTVSLYVISLRSIAMLPFFFHPNNGFTKSLFSFPIISSFLSASHNSSISFGRYKARGWMAGEGWRARWLAGEMAGGLDGWRDGWLAGWMA